MDIFFRESQVSVNESDVVSVCLGKNATLERDIVLLVQTIPGSAQG